MTSWPQNWNIWGSKGVDAVGSASSDSSQRQLVVEVAVGNVTYSVERDGADYKLSSAVAGQGKGWFASVPADVVNPLQLSRAAEGFRDVIKADMPAAVFIAWKTKLTTMNRGSGY